MRRLALLLLFVAGEAFAATRYASPTGSGSTCSIASPCDIDTCIDSAGMAAGDTCILINGTYTDPATAIASSLSCGTGANACTVRAETTGSVNIVFNSGTGDAFSLSNADNWTVQGIKLTLNAERQGFVFQNGDNLVATDLTALGYPIYSSTLMKIDGGSNVTVTRFTGRHDPTCTSTGDGRGYTCGGSTGDCDFEGPGGSGSVLNIQNVTTATVEQSYMGYMRNIGTFRNMTGLTYKRNLCENSVNHGCLDLLDVDTAVVENNINVFRTDGFCSDDHNGGDFLDTYCSKNVTIRNNTMASHNVGPFTFLYQFATPAGECNDGLGPEIIDTGAQYQAWKVYNNIFYNQGGIGISCLGLQSTKMGGTSPWVATHNLYSDCGGTDKVGYPDDTLSPVNYANWLTTDVDGDGTNEEVGSTACSGNLGPTCAAPSFTVYSSGSDDFTAASGSASQVDTGINSGSTLCPSEDYAGTARTGTCDIGAYTKTAGAPPATTRRRAHITIPK